MILYIQIKEQGRNVSVHSEGDCLGNVKRKAENIISYKIVRFF